MLVEGGGATPPERNPYEVLGVQRDASVRDIKRAYRTLAKKLHPDHADARDGKAAVDAKFVELSEAYEVLSDNGRRANYDATGDPELSRAAYGHGYGHGHMRGGAPIFSPAAVATAATFNHVVENKEWPGPTAILFFSHRSAASVDFVADFNKVAKSLHGIVSFVTINTDVEWRLTRQFSLHSVPTILTYDNGKYARYRGYFRAGPLRSHLLSLVPTIDAADIAVFPKIRFAAARTAIDDRVRDGWPVVVACSSKRSPSPLFSAMAGEFARQAAFFHVQTAANDVTKWLGCTPGDPSLVVVRSVFSDPAAFTGDLDALAIRRWLETVAPLVPELNAVNYDDVCGTSPRSPISGCLALLNVHADELETLAALQSKLEDEQWARGVRLATIDASRDAALVGALAATDASAVFISPGQRVTTTYDRRPDAELGAWLESIVEDIRAGVASPPGASTRHDLLPRPTLAGYGSRAGALPHASLISSAFSSLVSTFRFVASIVQTMVTLGFTLVIVFVFMCGMLGGGGRVYVG